MTYTKKPYAGMSSADYYAAETRNKIYDIRDAGCYVDDSHDDTANVQATINEAYSNGGGIIMIPDTGKPCIIDGALQTNVGGINYNSQLYIPNGDADEQTRCNVIIRGEGRTNLHDGGGLGASISLFTHTEGSILKSTLVNGTANAYVIGSKGAAGNAITNMNFNQCDVEDLRIQVTADGSSRVTIGGIGFNDAAMAIIKSVAVFPHNVNLNDSAAPINNCVGIALPKINCSHFNVLENCSVGGFDSGYLTGDHFHINNSAAVCCKYGYNIGANNQIGYGTKLMSFWNINDIYISGASRLMISSIQTEWADLGKWYDSAYTVLDASNNGKGEIHYSITAAGVGFDDSKFSKSGGANLQCMPIAFAAASEFTVTGARDEPEGALASLITALAAKGIIVDNTTAS